MHIAEVKVTNQWQKLEDLIAEKIEGFTFEGSKEYTLYFRNNSYFISDSDKKILADAVAEYNKLGNVKIKIDGSADALGTAKYNKALSGRRALATEQALVEMGIDAGEILTRGEGIIGTKPNPSNRRVDIYFAK